MYEWAGRWLHTSRTRTDTDLGVPVQVNQAYKSPSGLIVATIELTRGYVARIDEADRAFTDGHKWFADVSRRRRAVYASTLIEGMRVGLHSLLCPDWAVVDHEDGDGLNNCRYNLRDGAGFRNAANRELASNNTSGYKGVDWNKRKGKWRAIITVDGKQIFLGYFGTAEAAADAYDEAAVHHFGAYARTSAMMGQVTDARLASCQRRPAPAERTHCPAGHEYTPENTHIRPDGRRRCRTCARLEAQERRLARGGPQRRKCPPGCTCGRHRRAA